MGLNFVIEIWTKTQHNIIGGLYIFLNICISALKRYQNLDEYINRYDGVRYNIM